VICEIRRRVRVFQSGELVVSPSRSAAGTGAFPELRPGVAEVTAFNFLGRYCCVASWRDVRVCGGFVSVRSKF
jgi:hypothetical protein